MKTSSKLATLAGGLALALTTLAAPAAMAAPFAPKPAVQFAQNDRHDRHDVRGDRDNFRFGYDSRKFRDRFHKPPVKFEVRGHAPHRGYHYRPGKWNWQRDHWVWIIGAWVR